MNRLSKILVSPAAAYGWSAGLFVAIFFALPFFKYVLDEELLVTLSILCIKYFAILLLVISLLTSIVFFDWFKRNWYINLIVFGVAATMLVKLYTMPDPPVIYY